MPAAIAAATARIRAAAPDARCEAAGPLALSCVEQLDADHFTAVDIRAERLPDGAAGGDAVADRPTIGPGGGGGRYRQTTADGAFAVTAVEFQRLLRGSEPRMPPASRLAAAIVADYDAGPRR